METLYDILGALPDDDAESIRAAFRKAAKANHPDNNPGDPDAPLRFRRTVRANAILRDERLRATYDQLLEIALKQRPSESERGSSSRSIRKIAPDAIAVVLLLTLAFVGGYLLLGHISKVSFFSAKMIEGSRPEPAWIAAATPTELSDKIDLAGPPEKFEEVVAPNKAVGHNPVKEAVPSASPFVGKTVNATAIPDVPRARDFGVNDASYYKERGVLAYRSGDLYLALIDFDLAIDLNPSFSDAYIDRGIVFHRMGDLKRAFADIAQAKRIDASKQNNIPPIASAP
jgi:curved DNA-binding protein CbpA